MKISPKPSGHIILAFLALIAVLAILILGWRIVFALDKFKYDPNHGQGTNAEPDSIMVARVVADLSARHADTVITVPQLNLTVAVTNLLDEWNYRVQSSTNLIQWADETMTWGEALDSVATNHDLECRFFRRVVWR